MHEPHDDFMRELVTIFSAEADERLAVVDRQLAEFERTSSADVRADLLKDILRELHTIKGSAGAVNLPDVSRMSHGLETLVASIASDALVDPAIYERTYRGLDALRAIVGDAVSGTTSGVTVDAALVALNAPVPSSESGSATLTPFAEVSPSFLPVPESTQARAEGASPEPTEGASGASPRIDETVRLATNKLDSLMARVGELVVTRIGAEHRASQVRELTRRVKEWERDWQDTSTGYSALSDALHNDETGPGNATLVRQVQDFLPLIAGNQERWHDVAQTLNALRSGVEADERRLGQVTQDLEDEVRRTRMLPVSTAVDPLHRLTRTLSRELGKEVALHVTGADTEVDRSVLEQLRSPLTHLIRNAIDHGIEMPDVREHLGKPREATIRIATAERGGTLLLSLADDGAGIDRAAVGARAVHDGLVTAEQLGTMADREILRLITRSGFSTREDVTNVSGRGVGLDAVRETVERLQGTLDVTSDEGEGTTLTLSVPLSVATTQCLVVRSGGHRLAMPINSVVRIVRIGDDDIGSAHGRDVVLVDDSPVLLTRLDAIMGLEQSSVVSQDGTRPALILGADEQRFAVLVDGLEGTHDVVVKPLPQPFVRVRHAAGATALGTGEVVVVVNTADVIRFAATASARRRATAALTPAGPRDLAGTARRRATSVMVVDDSIVTRMLEKTILEAAGYNVTVASDGAEAWRLLQESPVDVVVSDINMPKMDGLELVAALRADGRLSAIPVVLVTSLDAQHDHARAIEVGADAYIVKSNFSQEGLLDSVDRLVPRR